MILTVFWVDNFDINVEAQCGGGAVNITHLMAFQEVTDATEYISTKVNLIKSKKPVIVEDTPDEKIIVDVKKEPNTIVVCGANSRHPTVLCNRFEKTYFMWLILRWV